MKRYFNPVDVKLNIENPSIERDAFYRLCFITESDIAPRTLKVTRLQDLLDNGYSRLDLVYNFCVGVFSQQGMDAVYIRAKRSYESYVEAYNSDDNSMYYFVVLQTKDLTEVEKFNSHLVSSDDMKLQFFSQNVGSKILQSPKLVNYYQDYTLSGGASVESKDYYLNKAYSGVTVINRLPLPDYLLGGYGNTAVDYGVRMMVGRDYIWEIDKPNRQIRYARNVIESGWVGSREESTISNSEVTVVATKGISGKLLRASIKDPKVKIETISRELLKGLGKEVLDYAIPLIDPEAKDWVLDPANNAVKFNTDGLVGETLCTHDNGTVWTADKVCTSNRGSGSYAVVAGASHVQCNTGTVQGWSCASPSPSEVSIPIDTVSQQVIANADSGHTPSQTFLKSIPLFAYLLTGSGTEAVNKAVLDIDPEATDWVLDPENNRIKYTVAGGGSASQQYIISYQPTISDLYGQSYPTAQDAADAVCSLPNKNGFDYWYDGIPSASNNTSALRCKGGAGGSVSYLSVLNPDYDPNAPTTEERYIPITVVAQQVISNAESGHAPSQEALKLATVERVNTGEYDEALESASIEIETSWKYLPIYDVAVQVKRNSIAGHAESIEAVNNSLPFELPKYEPNITITGIAKVGETLTATVTDENGLPSNINYQWYADGEVIIDATSETYAIKESDSGKTITVQADFTDKDGFSESVTDTVDVEVVDTGDMGLKADYSGSGWYKATDTGTVFNKGVPEGETHVFSDSPKEYVSVYTKDDAKLYGERAAVSNVTDMSGVFRDATSFNSDISSWDVSSVADMSSMFEGTTSFNQDLSSWNTSKVTDMYRMFYSATAFNQDISMLDVSSVVTMEFMFYNATSFNQDISSWDVSSVANMNRMFNIASSYNQDLSKWCVSLIPTRPSYFDTSATAWTLPKPVWGTCPRHEDGSVPVELSPTGLKADYSGTGWYKATDTGTVFNKDVPALETHVFSDSPTEYVSVYTKEDANSYGSRAAVSNITDMEELFKEDTEFNEDISSWDVSSVINMNNMFANATSFNQDISSWDVSNVTDMRSVFYEAKSFNSDISSWDVSTAIDMRTMFYNATSFKSDISSWDVSNVTDMRYMFNKANTFNSDISNWDVSKVTDMYSMFDSATTFNQDLSGWCVTLIPTKPTNFNTSTPSWTLPKPVWGTCPRGESG